MTTGSGLDAQIMFAQETTWGTAVTPTRSIEFNDESLNQDITYVDSAGLHAGNLSKRSSRTKQSRFSVSGDVTMELATLGMGLFVKHMLGSDVDTPTQIAATTAYQQIHTPSGLWGFGMTAQVGRPEPSTGTVQPFTYAGLKVTGWELAVKDGGIATLKLTFDGKSENTATALAATAFLDGSTVFSFKDATIKLGGTAATADGETTVTGGTAMSTVATSITITGANPLATDRYGIGNAGQKKEQLQNGLQTITIKMDSEFSKTELYSLYTAGTPVALQLTFTGDTIAGSNHFLFDVILPSVFLKKAPPSVNGPDIVQMSTEWEAEWDETNPPIQVKIVSTESSAI